MKRLLFFGLNTVDLQFLVPAFPAKNTKTKAERNGVYAGGPATNAAIACAHLGGRVTLVTPIGQHVLSGFIAEDIRRHNVDIWDPLEALPGDPTFASIITDEENGDRTVFSYHPELKLSETVSVTPPLAGYGFALFDGFYPRAAVQLAQQCRERDIVTVLDAGSWKPGTDRLLGLMDVVICSNDFHVSKGDDAKTIFKELHSRGVSMAAVTRGDRSILFSDNGRAGEVFVENVSVVDTLGAGDIYHGAFLYYFANGESFKNALSLASRVAARSCRHFGTRDWMK